MIAARSGPRRTLFGAIVAILGGVTFAGCHAPGLSTDEVESPHKALGEEPEPPIPDPNQPIITTLAPVRHLDEEDPGNIYLRSFAETFPGTGTFVHSVHVYQSDGSGEAINFELSATDAGGAVDNNHRFRAVMLTSHPGQADQRQRPFADAAGRTVFAHPMSRVGWFRFDFEYVAPNPGRTLTFKAYDSAGNPLKSLWDDPSGTNVQVVASIKVDQESPAFLKGGAYRNATTGEYAFIDNVTVDGQLLYRDELRNGGLRHNHPELAEFLPQQHQRGLSHPYQVEGHGKRPREHSLLRHVDVARFRVRSYTLGGRHS